MPFYKGGGIHCLPLKQMRDLIAITGKIFLGTDLVFQAIAALPHILAMHFKSCLGKRRDNDGDPLIGHPIQLYSDQMAMVNPQRVGKKFRRGKQVKMPAP